MTSKVSGKLKVKLVPFWLLTVKKPHFLLEPLGSLIVEWNMEWKDGGMENGMEWNMEWNGECS